MFIVANWKMNGRLRDVHELAQIADYFSRIDANLELILCLPSTMLYYASQKLSQGEALPPHIYLGGQNMHWHTHGAYTGSISASMLQDVGAQYVILGHCECRRYQAETDDLIASKLKAALSSGLKPIICIGENIEEKQNVHKVLEQQILTILGAISEEQMCAGGIVLAYEPVWAIGTGLVPSILELQEIFHFIKELLQTKYNASVASSIKLLYGGSVDKTNIENILNIDVVEGALVGSASLKAADFIPILELAKKISLAK